MFEELKITIATIEDIELICSYRMRLWDDAGKFKDLDEYNQVNQLNKEYFEEQFSNNSIFVPIIYKPGTKDIISIGIGVILKKPVINLEDTGLEGYIFNMHTESDYRKKGLSTSILNELVKYFKTRNVNKISLNSNDLSFNLYDRNGFLSNKYYQELIF